MFQGNIHSILLCAYTPCTKKKQFFSGSCSTSMTEGNTAALLFPGCANWEQAGVRRGDLQPFWKVFYPQGWLPHTQCSHPGSCGSSWGGDSVAEAAEPPALPVALGELQGLK